MNRLFTMFALSCLLLVALVHAQTKPPTDIATSRDSIKALYAQNAADRAAIISTQKQIDSGADNPVQLQSIITAKRQDIEKNMRTIEGMLQDVRIEAGRQTAVNVSAHDATSESVQFEYDDAAGNDMKHTHSIAFQAYNAKMPHANWAQLDSDEKGITIHVRYGDSGWWQHKGKLLIAVP